MDLDPALEDILSMWGKETTEKNVDLYFGGQKFPDVAVLPPFLHHGGIPAVENVSASNQVAQGQSAENDATEGFLTGGLSSQNKSKSVVCWNLSSIGLEGTESLGCSLGVGKENPIGGFSHLSRVSLSRDQHFPEAPLPQGCEGSHGHNEETPGVSEVPTRGICTEEFQVGGPSSNRHLHQQDVHTEESPQDEVD